MRNLLTFAQISIVAACTGGPEAFPAPPTLKVTSPQRSLVSQTGEITVTGTVTPNAEGVAVQKVVVNNVEANLNADGTWNATIEVPEGASLIETVASDARGTTATDTRAVHAGRRRPVGTTIPDAIAVAMSRDAFARISAAAGPIVLGLDLGAMLAPMQPMVHFGDDDGEDCAFARLFIDDVKLAAVQLALTPVAGGLAFRAELDGLDVPGRVRYAVLCADFARTLRVAARKVTVAGTLQVTPNGMAGFATRLVDPDVSITGLDISAAGIPDDIIELLHLEAAIELVVARAAELAMNPLMNQALGALGGPQSIDVLGKQLTIQVAPSAITFTPDGAELVMSLRALIAGSEASPGFVFTDHGAPALDPAYGFQLGIADDLANQMLAELQQIGALDLTVPAEGGVFEAARLQMTLAPMISADASDGRMRLVLGDMLATFLHDGAAVGKAAINARVDLAIEPLAGGDGVALQLGTPEIHVDVLDDLANVTGLGDDVLGQAVEAGLAGQLRPIARLLRAIPLPRIAGLQARNVALGADDGYVMISGQID